MAKTDRILKLYAETIQSPFLHYGYWDEPEKVDISSIGITQIVEAQKRYIENLSSYIPDSVEDILEVGCGLGGNSAFLQELGFKVEALSPDPYQKKVFEKKFNHTIPFYFSKFENFNIDKTYDLVLMSESATYIKIHQSIENSYKLLGSKGYLLISDYFIYHTDGSDSPHLKSAHDLELFLSEAKTTGFKLLNMVDVTKNVIPTLDAANHYYIRFLKPVANYATISFKRKHPKILSFLKWLYGKKIDKKMKQLDFIKSEEFCKYRKYMILLFQKVQ